MGLSEHTKIDALTRNATLAADSVAIGFIGTGGEQTRAIVQRAIEFMVGNGLIEVKPQDEWPVWLVWDPPYRIGE